jgi:hypothetical protein
MIENNDELVKQFEIREEHIVEGITADYVWYHSKKLLNQMGAWQYEFERVVKVMENRHTEHLKIIEDLLRQNKALKAKAQEK